MTEIDELETWHNRERELAEEGYTLWQMQYDARQVEGFHIWFWASERPEIEFVTHNVKVQEAMVKYQRK